MPTPKTAANETQVLQKADMHEISDDFHSRKTEPFLPPLSSHPPRQPRKTLPMFPPFSQPPPLPTKPVEAAEEGPAFFTMLEQERCLAALEEVNKPGCVGGEHGVDGNCPEAQKHDGSAILTQFLKFIELSKDMSIKQENIDTFC